MNPTINPAFLATDSLEAELIAQLQSQSLNATEDALGDAPNFSLFNTTYDNHVERSPAIPQGFEGDHPYPEHMPSPPDTNSTDNDPYFSRTRSGTVVRTERSTTRPSPLARPSQRQPNSLYSYTARSGFTSDAAASHLDGEAESALTTSVELDTLWGVVNPTPFESQSEALLISFAEGYRLCNDPVVFREAVVKGRQHLVSHLFVTGEALSPHVQDAVARSQEGRIVVFNTHLRRYNIGLGPLQMDPVRQHEFQLTMHSVRYAMKAEGKTFLDDYELTPAAHRGIAKGTQDYQDFVKNATDAFQNGRYRHAPDLQDGTPFLYRNLAYRRFVYRFLYASHLRIGKRHGDMFLFGLPHGLLAMLHIAVQHILDGIIAISQGLPAPSLSTERYYPLIREFMAEIKWHIAQDSTIPDYINSILD